MQNNKLIDFINRKKVLILIIFSVLFFLCVITFIVIALLANNNQVKNNFTNNESIDNNNKLENEFYSTTVENQIPICNLNKIEYKENAFSIGVPNGWLYEVNSGTVSIMEDDSNTTAAFFYTAKLEKDISTNDLLNSFSNVFKNTIESINGTFTTSNINYDSDSASASLNSTIGNDNMKGELIILKSGNFAIFKAYWAPVQSYDEKLPLLKDVSNCFGMIKVLTDEILTYDGFNDNSNITNYTGKYFKLNKPDNFTVTGETDSGIDLTRNDGNAGFSYAYATGFTGNYTPQTWAYKALPEYAKISNLQLSAGNTIPSQISGHSVQEFFFTGNLNGYIPVKGKTTVGIYKAVNYGVGPQYTSAFWAIQISTPEVWESVKNTLQSMQDSFQIIDIGSTRKNTLLPSNRPMETTSSSITSKSSSYSSALDDESSENWAEAMRGYESVSSPSTGQTYDVPINSWSSYGPEGPGYYRLLPDDSLEKLN